MFCQKCGSEIDRGAAFCSGCGAPINGASVAKTKKKKKKKGMGCLTFFCLIVILATILIVSSIDSSASGQPIEDSATVGTAENVSNLLVDNEAFAATFVKAQDEPGLGVFYVFIKIENKTDFEIVVNLDDADVDGESIPLITTGVPLVIRPGNSGQTGFIFSMVNLSIDTMENAENATFRIVARNSETFSVISESDLVTVSLH